MKINGYIKENATNDFNGDGKKPPHVKQSVSNRNKQSYPVDSQQRRCVLQMPTCR